jgi:hypothetical protein
LIREKQNHWRIYTLSLLAIVILLTGTSLYFYGKSVESEARYDVLHSKIGEISYKVDLLINFGNGSKTWYNETYVPVGMNLLDLTLKSTEGNVTFAKGQYGIFVTAINGVGSNPADRYYSWLWWNFNLPKEQWSLGEVGADQYVLSEGDIIAWYYQDTSTFPDLKPPS